MRYRAPCVANYGVYNLREMMMAVVWPSARARPGGFTEGRRPDDGTTSPKHLKGTRLCVYERGHMSDDGTT